MRSEGDRLIESIGRQYKSQGNPESGFIYLTLKQVGAELEQLDHALSLIQRQEMKQLR